MNGPGINASINLRSTSVISCAISSIFLLSAKCTINGLSDGLPLAIKIFPTAFSSKALAPMPYTVSVGNITSSPFLIKLHTIFNSSVLVFSVQL